MPRISILTNMWPSADAPTRGGFVQEQVEDLRRLLPEWTFEVSVIDGRRGRRDYVRGILDVRRRARSGVDLIHAHYGLTGGVAAFQRRVPVVVTYHGSDVYIPWQRRISAWAAGSAAANIFVSERLRDRLGGGGVVIPCGVDPALFAPGDRRQARDRLGMGDDDVVILFPGDPDRDVKGYPLFRAVLDALPDEVRLRVREVKLRGLLHTEVPERLHAADAVLMTSRYEGAGTVAKEAVGCGVPVVSTDVGDVGTVIEGLPGCAVAEAEVDALAAALLDALTPRPAWDGGTRLAELGVDRESVARRVAEVYRSVLGEKGAPAGGG